MRKMFFFVIIFQLIIIALLSLKIIKNKVVSFTPIQNKSIISEEIDGLKYFYELRPNYINKEHPSWLPYTATQTINKDGLNERYDYSVQKDQKTFRIITLGNSFTYGEYVNTKDNWTEVLEELLNKNRCNKISKYEVINLGVHGYDLAYEVERYKIRGMKYKPDLILWFAIGYDKINEYILRKGREITKEMGLSKNSNEYFYKDGLYYPSYTRALYLQTKELGEQNILNYQKKILQKFNGLYKGSLLLFTFPNLPKNYKEMFSDFVESRDNTIFDIEIPSVNSISNATLFDGHPSIKGHRLIAQSIFDYLKKQKKISIPCLNN